MADAQNNLRLFYNDTDITDSIDILECVTKDVSGKESDCMNLLVDHADRWFKWGVEKNDKIRATRSGYDTKNLFLNTIAPEDGAFRIYATAAKCAPFEPEWISYENMTLAGIMAGCAAEGGMGFNLHGINPQILYEYLWRKNQRATEFLDQLLNREGAVLKCLNGCFTAIGIGYAQEILCYHSMKIGSGMENAEYIDRRDQAWSSVTIDSPFGKGKAIDVRGKGQAKTFTDICVDSDGQAKRWARGILLCHNRQNEILNVELDFNPGYTAMVRIDVDSATAAAGNWIVDRVEHDLLVGRTKAKLLRCVTSII